MSYLNDIGFTHFWQNLKDNFLSKKQDVLTGEAGQTVIFNSQGTMEAAERNHPVYTVFTGVTAGTGVASIGNKMTYAIGMRDGASLMTNGLLHSYVNMVTDSTGTNSKNTTTFSFGLTSAGFTMQKPDKITGITTAFVTPNMTYPMQYTITGGTNGINVDCEIFAVLTKDTPVSFSIHVPIMYIGTASDAVSIQRVLDEVVSSQINEAY